MKMRSGVYLSAAAAALLFLGSRASAQVLWTFSDGTSDGWDTGGFSSPGGTPNTIDSIAGTNYIHVPIGGFQVDNFGTGGTNATVPQSAQLLATMNLAEATPTAWNLSFTYYINTADFTGASAASSYLQLGAFVNDGTGDYAQAGTLFSLNGTQVASGSVFTGTVTTTLAAAGLTVPTANLPQTFWRLGLIENGDQTNYFVDFTNISITPVPEPASICGLSAMGAMLLLRRRPTA